MTSIAATIANEINVRDNQVEQALKLLAEGNTVPFIARYRKEATGGLDDAQLRHIEERNTYLLELAERKQAVLESIEEQGKLTDELKQAILAADTKARVEDLYLPYKRRRKTKADIAREAGLEALEQQLIDDPSADPETLAEAYLSEGFPDAKSALEGARAILVDRFATDADLVGEVRDRVYSQGTMRSAVVEGKETEGAKFADYFEFSEPFEKLPSHRILALLRGEAEGVLTLDMDPGEEAVYEGMIAERFDLPVKDSEWLAKAVRWGWRTKLQVSANLDTRMRLKEKAEVGALQVFKTNLRDVLLAAPAGQRATLALDPGYRNGVKCAVVDETGKVLATTIVYPHQPQNRWDASRAELASLAAQHGVELIAVGNGTASRESEKLAGEVADLIAQAGGKRPTPVVVSESGASVYSASQIAAEEFPDMDVSLRSAVSIARRLQDPLAELVKVDPKSIGVGQYQHDLDQAELSRTLGHVVEDVVNRVGVDVNTASASLLGYVSGITPSVAKNIVAYREENGAFTDRRQLKKVPKLGPKAYLNAAGFLRISGGKNPLDATSVHPESYEVATAVLDRAGVAAGELSRGGVPDIERRLGSISALASDLDCGTLTLIDIVNELKKPGRDPRDDAPEVVFSRSALSIDDLEPGMELKGTVRNVVDFGAFVDVGVHQDGLVHISKLANRFVKHPSDVVRVGDTVKVWVEKVDRDRKKISLTMVQGK